MMRGGVCRGCGYDLRGISRRRCPECGLRLSAANIVWPERPLGWRVHVVDLAGLAVVTGVNGLLVTADVAAVWVGRMSWFTDPLWHSGPSWGRGGPQSTCSLLLWVLALSLAAWAAAWELWSWTSWRWQIALTVWCWLLTVFHAVGAASLWS